MRTLLTATARRLVRWEYVPEAVLLLGLTAFFVDQNDAATSAFKSSRALAIMAAVTAGWLGARLLLARLVRVALARAAVFSVAAVVALSVVVFPAYDNDTVIESFPAAAAVPAPAAATSPAPSLPDPDAAVPSAAPSSPAAAPAEMAAGPSPGPAAPSTTTTAASAVSPAAPTTTTTTATTAPPPAEAAPVAASPPERVELPAGPQRLRSAPIRGIDHRASGTAAIYRQPDGRYVVGLEDIDIQPGPDYDLYVVPGENREDTKGGTRLGDLRGNRGTQFYGVPPGVNLEDGPWTVLVWCQTFAVPVAGATPS